MALFNFGKKVEAAKEYLLEEIPVFSALSPNEQKLVEKKARLFEFKRGDLVYREGTPADAFFVVISGRFRLFTQSPSGSNQETLAFFHRGDHFGETSLLTGRPHSGSVEAKRDGILLKLDRDDFLKLFQDIPAISLHLSRSLGHRLTSSIRPGGRREVKIAAFYAPHPSDQDLRFWLDFSMVLRSETNLPVILVDLISSISPSIRDEFQKNSVTYFDFGSMEPSREADLNGSILEHPKGFHYLHAPVNHESYDDKTEKKVSTLLTFLTYRYNFLLLRIPGGNGHVAFQVLKQSDHVYVYCPNEAGQLKNCAEALDEFQKSFGFSRTELRVLSPEEKQKDNGISCEEIENILGQRIFSVLPSKENKQERYYLSVRYLAKEMAGKLVGLVLGSGAAYGLAHIGVLRVLEQEGIDIDVIAGSSMGAFIGSIWAAGYKADQLEKIAKTIDAKSAFFKLIGFQDLSVAHRGFFKGNQIVRFMRSILGDRTFQDLDIPLKVVAVDLFTSEEIVFDSGSVVDAVRASISIPGIFRPYHYQGRTLIDGGVVDPLPIRALAKLGVKKIIAVNVLSGPKDRIESNDIRTENRRRQLEKKRHRKGIFGKIIAESADQMQNRYAVNVFNVIMNTVQFMEYEIAEAWGEQADVLIHPTVAEGHWAEFYSPDKFIKAGEERTREKIDDIRRLLVE